MHKPIYPGLVLLELSNLLMHETYYDKLQPYLDRKKPYLLFIDTDSFIFSVYIKIFIIDLKNMEDLIDFSNLSENDELVTDKNKMFWGKSRKKLLKIFGLMNLFV